MNGSDTYDLKPSKEAYQAVKSDVTPVSAFKELVDNALDNWRRVLDGLDPVTIEIEYHDGGPDGEDEVVIRDDSGGVEEDDLQILFALGQSKKEDIAGSIGAYGIGAKKAILNLGNKATIRSRHMYADTGFGFTIDEEWLQDDEDWTVEKEEYEDIEAGVTEIRISDLNTPWNKYRENLVEDLSKTYQYFLDPDRMEDFEPVSIIIREYDTDGEATDTIEVEPPEPVDWSFTPMDGLFVRRYEGIDLQSKEFEAEVTLNVTVGLMREASAEDSGADIFCQNRLVLSGVTDERAGFGMGSNSSKLGKFSGQHRRLRVIIEFETEGDARILPWDAQKSDIDPYTRVSRAARDWIGRIVRPYYLAAGAYDHVPTTLTRPYDRDCEHSVTKHLDDPYDYEGRKRVMHKPDTDFSDAKEITERVDVTTALRIYSPDPLPDEFEPAYREEFLRTLRDEYDIDVDREESIPTPFIPAAEVPDDLDMDESHRTRMNLTQHAREDAAVDPPQRKVGFPDWQQPLYDTLLREQILSQQADEDADKEPAQRTVGFPDWGQARYEELLQEKLDSDVDLEELETVELGYDFDVEELKTSEVDEDEESDEPEEPAEGEETDELEESDDSPDIDGETGELEESDDTPNIDEETDELEESDDTPDIDEESDVESIDSERPASDVGKSSGESVDGVDTDDEPTQIELSSDTGTSSTAITPHDTDDSETTIETSGQVLELTDEQWNTLVEALGLDEDATTEEVRERLFETMDTLRKLPTS
ncbi:ATP-binding protein [Halopiger xanaduensis]|uniref:ATP-binding region ATPase domain protein n=1 Tax=Halopiger xanaduensis (strain DSM 18323 / JCM 14033 / SH-6) TaxID=797210 RepID=F8D4Q6_HALXS|nr:ATP-binding protein [Halopiger xanaduensis]AEH37525.1 hypothetical protein Halxa_2909 [Halopiger xanaduensis SH-6]